MVKCPNCGIETAREPGIVQRVRGWFRRGEAALLKPAPGGLCNDTPPTLDDLRQGESAIVEKFLDNAHIRKFLSLGILPGTSVTILKQFPAVVLRVGYSEFAFDRALARTVTVRRV
jgi:Fe2+ transport system protein FeoA